MTSRYDTYTSPLAERNASAEMLRLWSARHKFNTWRRIWLAVAEAQHELGLPVSKAQVEELRGVVERGISDAEIEAAGRYERELRHDVMAHVHVLGDSCPVAKGIIHLGMTSQDVNDNAELHILGPAIGLMYHKSARVVLALAEQAEAFASIPTLAFTHYQPAQPMTVGRRMAQWAYELSIAARRLEVFGGDLQLRRRGLRGATGTQASFLSLCDGNGERVDELERRMWYALCEKRPYPQTLEERARHVDPESIDAGVAQVAEALGEIAEIPGDFDWEGVRDDVSRKLFESDIRRRGFFVLVGQTYPRVFDTCILADLASTAAVLHKIATDIRLLCNRKELDEPFEDKQIGSSAMPYKRNPMRCERICGLTRFVMNLVGNAYDTAATQWLERTLDDSSNRRLSLPEAFLALDGALDLMHNVASGLIVHEAMVKRNLMAELPFLATENILMEAVKAGGDRQHYHEVIRRHAQAAGARVKDEGLDNDLIERLRGDAAFHPPALKHELNWDGLMDPMKYIGRSVEQTERFIAEVVEPLRAQYGEAIAKLGESGPRV